MTKTATLDLASLSATAACDKGYEFELKHPVNEAPLGVFITVLGKESGVFRDFLRSKANDQIRRQVAMQKRGKDAETPTVEQAEANAIELLAACTVSWRTGDAPTITHAGKALDCTEANARFLYTETWIREQVDTAVGDLGNFLTS